VVARFTYSRWDGSQVGFELDADSVLEEITDDLLYHGDLNNALRRMMQSGFRDQNGDRLQGLRELMEKLRRRRSDVLEQHNLGGVYDDIAQELREIVEQERQSLEDRMREARESNDPRRQELAETTSMDRNLQLDMLPPDLAGQVKDLQNYDFVSQEAQQRFEELLDKLRQQIMQSQLNQMSGAMQNMGPEQMQRTKDMLSELNNLLEQRNQGQDTDQAFQQFM